MNRPRPHQDRPSDLLMSIPLTQDFSRVHHPDTAPRREIGGGSIVCHEDSGGSDGLDVVDRLSLAQVIWWYRFGCDPGEPAGADAVPADGCGERVRLGVPRDEVLEVVLADGEPGAGPVGPDVARLAAYGVGSAGCFRTRLAHYHLGRHRHAADAIPCQASGQVQPHLRVAEEPVRDFGQQEA